MLVQRNLPHEIEDVVVQEKRKEEEGGGEGGTRWIKVARSGNLRSLRGEGKKIEKDVSHRSHGTEEPATLVVVVAAVVFVVVSRERDRVIYIEAGKRPFTKTVMKKEERNDEFSMREEQRPRSPDGRDNRRLVTPRASLAIIETGRGRSRSNYFSYATINWTAF